MSQALKIIANNDVAEPSIEVLIKFGKAHCCFMPNTMFSVTEQKICVTNCRPLSLASWQGNSIKNFCAVTLPSSIMKFVFFMEEVRQN